MSDLEFVDGFIAKAPSEKAPDYVKAKVSLKRDELIRWLQQRQDEWINLEIKEGRTGKQDTTGRNPREPCRYSARSGEGCGSWW